MKRTREEKERSGRNDRISLRGQDHIDEQPAPSEKVTFAVRTLLMNYFKRVANLRARSMRSTR